jgi:hypothetical protein
MSFKHSTARLALIITTVSLLVLVVFFAIGTSIQASHMVPLSYNEGWNASNLKRFGLSTSPYTFSLWAINNYPPLWYELIRLTQTSTRSTGIIWIGRAIGALGTIGATIAVFALARRSRVTFQIATIGASLFLLVILGVYPGYAVLADPQMPALALMLFALLLASQSNGSTWSDTVAIALMVIAGFTKHSLIAIPLGCFLHWSITRPRGQVLRNLLIAAAFGAAAFALCLASYGPGFLESLFRSPRYYSAAVGLFKVATWIAALPALAWMFLCAASDTTIRSDAVSGLFVRVAYVALAITLLTAGGGGTSYNLAFELIAVCCVLTAICLHRSQMRLPGSVTIPFLGFLVVSAASASTPTARRLIAGSLGAFDNEEAGTAQAVKLLRSLAPGDVVCSSPILCIWAGRSSAIDWYTVWQGVLSRRVSHDELIARVTSASVSGLELRSDALDGLNAVANQRDAFRRAVMESFVKVDTAGGSIIYRRAGQPLSQKP